MFKLLISCVERTQRFKLYLVEMVVRVDVSTWVVWVDHNNGHSVLVCNGFDAFEIDLPFSVGEKIELADLETTVDSASVVVRETGTWEQYVCVWSSQRFEHQLYPLVASSGQEDVVRR